jgi:class 3 adenylate cyclase/tetratricopeptide (TPR) repeat protein
VHPEDRFCSECGQALDHGPRTAEREPAYGSERKLVSVLCSDLSGYTTISEKLDPEEVKAVMSQIFGEIAQVVTKYEGFIEKFIGDAVVAIFGVPKAHEDDAIRAIRAAKEIHDLVHAMSPQFEQKVGQPLSMHTGISTGLVVTGEVDLERATYGLAGDTINVASRLSGLGKEGEILVDSDTYRQAEGYFSFHDMELQRVKGKKESVRVYKVISAKERPITTHRVSGLRADLIGRKAELAQLEEAVYRLEEGRGGIYSICGDAGTGKSRLLEEFRATLDLSKMQWLEGHASAYSQNIPYFPLIDLMNRTWQIEEGDSADRVREKVESGIQSLVEKREEIVPYVGSLYALNYPEIGNVSPEFWKSKLLESITAVLSALTQRAPTVVCIEDIHWADPSSLDLIRFVLRELRSQALFICVYRPPFGLFASQQLRGMGEWYHEIRLQDLTPSEARDMIESLLQTKMVPVELSRFIQGRVEGNPFYLEEVINSLVEAGALVCEEGECRMTRPIDESDVPPTVQGVISARLDRMGNEMKRVLREASVIGRSFLYEILKKITELEDRLEWCLNGLEQLDLIRTRSLQPDLEYIFKHALTQEVVYKGLVTRERQAIHERIGHVMEQLFQDRLSEFYETLAYHFKNGESVQKAVDYLVKSGEKSLRRYAVEESNQHFREAFDLLSAKSDRKAEEEGLLIDLLIQWAFVFHYRGDFSGLDNLLSAHEDLTKDLDDKGRLGMFHALRGLAQYEMGKVKKAYEYLSNALELGETEQNHKVMGYACSWLAWVCTELGQIDDSILFGERAKELSKVLESEEYLFFNSLAGMGLAYYYKGERMRAYEVGKDLLEYGQRNANIRSLVLGHFVIGCSYLLAGVFPSAIKCFQRSVKVSADPWYCQFPRLFLGLSYILAGEFQDAENTLNEVLKTSHHLGTDLIGTPARSLMAWGNSTVRLPRVRP